MEVQRAILQRLNKDSIKQIKLGMSFYTQSYKYLLNYKMVAKTCKINLLRKKKEPTTCFNKWMEKDFILRTKTGTNYFNFHLKLRKSRNSNAVSNFTQINTNK